MADLVDRIYEAALVPERWSSTLAEIAGQRSSVSGALLVVDKRLPPMFAATENTTAALAAFAQSPAWHDNIRVQSAKRQKHAGFMIIDDILTEADRRQDMAGHFMQQAGLVAQIGTAVVMPSLETIIICFERGLSAPDFGPEDVAWFDGLRPHLARASLLAMQLRMERAQASADAMAAIGLPAAVIWSNGVVAAQNTFFDKLSHIFRPAAFGRLSVTNSAANDLLRVGLEAVVNRLAPPVQSVPLVTSGGVGIVIHILPLRGVANDIFRTGEAMIVVTGLETASNIPAKSVLRGLFDLTAAEADIAAGLSAGLALRDVAIRRGIGLTTARTHLASIFRKTGTSQQGQLLCASVLRRHWHSHRTCSPCRRWPWAWSRPGH